MIIKVKATVSESAERTKASGDWAEVKTSVTGQH